jgi:peptide/nickel transport system substrate-binding protein
MQVFKLPIISILAITLLTQIGCGPKSKAPDQTLNLRLSGEPNLLNPVLTTDVYSTQVTSTLFSGMLRLNEKLELEPDMAESYSISPDGKTYTFKLKKNIKWHDGKPFTAEDVVFTFNTIISPKTNTVRRSNVVINGKPVRFTAIDPHTVKAELPEPFAPFLLTAATDILPAHLLKGVDINTSTFNRHPIGTGPFKFQSWKTGQYIIVVKNNHYYGKKAKLDRIIFKPIPEYNAAKVALTKGTIDAFDLNPQDLESIKKIPHVTVYEYEQLQYSFVGFNLYNRHLKTLQVRQAIAHGVDRNALVDAVLKGHGTVAHVPVSPVSWAYPNKTEFTRYEFNPSQSITLLESAGYRRNKNGIFEKDGQPLSFKLIYGQGGKASPKNAEIIQNHLKKIGIELTIVPMEWQSFLRIVNSGKSPKEFDLCMLSWSLSVDPDDYSIWHSSEYPKGFNFIGYNNPKVDRLLTLGRSITTQKDRAKIYAETSSIIGQELPYLFLYYPWTISAVNRRVEGLSTPGPAGLFVRIEDITVQ